MNAEAFLANFRDIANAPGGVARLREVVLQLAVTGHLTDKDESEGTAGDLNGRVQAARLAFAKSEGAKLATITAAAAPSELEAVPPHWLWCKLGDLTTKIGSGSTPRGGSKVYVSKGIPFLRSQNVWNEGLRMDDVVYIPDATHASMKGTHVQVDDILLNITGASLGRCALVSGALGPANVSQHVTIVRTALTDVRQFIRLCLLSPFGQAMIWGRQVGMAREGLSKKVLEQFEIPLPPLAEQKRIVAKVEELMALCDQLEAQQQERERRFPVLSRTCHARFAEAPTPANLNRIFDETGAASPGDLRKTILNLALHGRLSERDTGDGSVESTVPTLASRALKAKDRHYPPHWIQVRLGDLGAWKGGGTPSKSVSEYWSGTMPWVSPKDMKKLKISDAEDHISEAAIEGSSVQLIPKNSLLMVVRGMILGRAFPVALTTREVTINQDMKALLPHAPETAEFLLFVLRAFEPMVLASIERSSHGTCKLLTEVLHSFPIPIPPLAEQRRIVAKVDELMALVDQLEAQQQERDKLAEAFAKACVASFTGTAQLERPEKMKAPKTELVSLVALGKTPKPDAKAPLAQLLIKAKGTLPAKFLWQQSGLSIDAFYQQLKSELAQGWIAPPAEAEMKEPEEA
jgi:type I restriction enzyme S subunit